MSVVFYAIGAAVLALLFTLVLHRKINSSPKGNPKMQEIHEAIKEGAMAFLMREYRYLAVFVVVAAIILGLVINGLTALSFVLGAIASALAGFIGMRAGTNANVRTTEAAKSSLSKALRIAFSSGAVMGLTVVGLGLIGVSVLFYVFNSFLGIANPMELIFGFSFGASSIALFARVGGGIYTKAADVGADLVGKVEAGIPEDDPRNPAVIADNVGDNVGDIAGMGADLFESYVGSIIAAMALGFIAFSAVGLIIPLMLAAGGIIASIIGVVWVNYGKGENIQAVLRNGTIFSAILMAVFGYFIIISLVPNGIGVFIALITGLAAGIIIGLLTEYYTSYNYKPTKELSRSSLTGSATNIIAGLSLGMLSTALPIIVLAIAIYIAFAYADLFGIALAGVGMLSTLGISLAVDAYGPVADNAGGIAEMSGLRKEVRRRTDALDAAGNTTAAMGKGFAIGSAALTALALFATFAAVSGLKAINVMNPTTMIGLLVGAMLPFLFASLAMTAVGKAAQEMIEEVRRQFKEIKGLLQGTAKGDHKRCVDISTSAALKRMVAPALLAILAPVAVGLLLGMEALGGLLAGSLVSGVALAILLANSGGAWDNAKKYIELGNFGGKGSEAHKAAVVGDTVGDAPKDCSGPSINILLKLMAIISLLFASVVGGGLAF